MPIVAVRLPQLGEGLQEALVIEFFRQPGDTVQRDDPLYSMETDKGTIDVESPYDGQLVQWLVETGRVHPIGAAIAQMEVAEGVEEMAAGHGPADRVAETEGESIKLQAAGRKPQSSRNRSIPPRTRRYLREHGLQNEADLIPAKSGKLTPEDVDAYLATKADGGGDPGSSRAAMTEPHSDAPLPISQQRLNYRLVRGAQVCVPVVISMDVDFAAIETARAASKDAHAENAPSAFVFVLWGVVQAMQRHAAFRTSLVEDGRKLRTFQHVNLGIAVALPDDMLVTAVVNAAEQLDWAGFTETVAQRIELARGGEDQATASTTVSVSNMGSVGIRSAIAAVVPPAVGTITLGRVFEAPVRDGDGFRFTPTATCTLTFDHRVVNGAGAARFFDDLKQELETFQLPQ